MSKKNQCYIYSTLSADVLYGPYRPGGGDIPERVAHVHIKGKAGITTDRLVTPRGVVTPVTAEQLAICEADPVFIMHRTNGFIVVDDADMDADNMGDSMAKDKGSAPTTAADFKAQTDSDGNLETGNQVIKVVAPAVKVKSKR